MAPPRQVAAPPKGSISVGWLWVSFLNCTSHCSVLPSTVTGTSMEQALISSLSSRLSALPCDFRYLVPMQAISIRQMSLFLPAYRAPRISRYRRRASSTAAAYLLSSTVILSSLVEKVVWRQWSDQ